MKTCDSCKRTLKLEEFNRNKSRPDGLQTKCRTCSRAYYREYYRNSPKEKLRLYKNNDAALAILRQEIRDLKESKPCTDCGIKYPYYVMQFDHISDNKSFSISRLSRKTRRQVYEEINKCELVCANCHAERTHSRLV